MTGGRAIFGSGPGALASDAHTLGVDPMVLRDRQDEAIGIIRCRATLRQRSRDILPDCGSHRTSSPTTAVDDDFASHSAGLSSLWWLAATKVSVSVAVIVHARVWLFQRARGQASRRTSTSSGFHENRRTGISRIYTSNMAVGMRDIEPDFGSCSADEAGTGELRVEYTLARDDIGVGPVARVADGLAALAAPAQNGRAFSVSLGSIGKRLSECSHRSRSGFAQEYG